MVYAQDVKEPQRSDALANAPVNVFEEFLQSRDSLPARKLEGETDSE